MDFYKELENIPVDRPHRELQEISKIAGKEEDRKYPYRNTCHKTVGEYFPTINDKIKVIY